MIQKNLDILVPLKYLSTSSVCDRRLIFGIKALPFHLRHREKINYNFKIKGILFFELIIMFKMGN